MVKGQTGVLARVKDSVAGARVRALQLRWKLSAGNGSLT
jgi:hypothetical protein